MIRFGPHRLRYCRSGISCLYRVQDMGRCAGLRRLSPLEPRINAIPTQNDASQVKCGRGWDTIVPFTLAIRVLVRRGHLAASRANELDRCSDYCSECGVCEVRCRAAFVSAGNMPIIQSVAVQDDRPL